MKVPFIGCGALELSSRPEHIVLVCRIDALTVLRDLRNARLSTLAAATLFHRMSRDDSPRVRQFARAAGLADGQVWRAQDSELCRQIRDRIERGDLVAIRLEGATRAPDIRADRTPVAPALAPPAPAPSALPAPRPQQTFFEVKLVDELGQPIAGATLQFEVAGTVTSRSTDQAGIARLDGQRASATAALLSIGDFAAMQALMRPRWQEKRPGEVLQPGVGIVVQLLRQPLAAVAIENERPLVISVQPPGRRVQVLEFEDESFHLDSAVFLPEGVATRQGDLPNLAQQRVRGIAVIRTLLQFIEQQPDQQVLIAGHTDTAGSKSHNLSLSDARAKSAHAFLTGDPDAWAAVAHARHKPEDVQTILKWLAENFRYPCDPGAIDGAFGARSKAALAAFRVTHAEVTGAAAPSSASAEAAIAPADWKAFYQYYELDLLEQMTLLDVAALEPLRDALTFVGAGTLACGEEFPIVQVGRDGFRSATNRRVELLCFDPDQVPEGLPGSPPGEPIYGSRRFAAQYIVVTPAPRPPKPLFSI